MFPAIQPMPLVRQHGPFSHPDWLFEIKHDGFRALAYIERGTARLLSRNGNWFKSFPVLCDSLASDLSVRSAVIDGEIVCLDRQGRTQFNQLLYRRGDPRFYAFDLLFLKLFAAACERDLEGIVAKWKYGKYVGGPETSWVKIKNPAYSQIQGRREQFDKMRQRAASAGT